MLVTLEECCKHIDSYLKSDNNSLPVLVDIPNGKTMQQFLQRYRVDGNTILPLSEFCHKDMMPRFDELLNELAKSTGTLFITEISAFYMLEGKEKLKEILSQLIRMSVHRKVVIVAYQSSEFYMTDDPRYKGNLYEVEGDVSAKPRLVFVKPGLKVDKAQILDGIDKVAKAIEAKDAKELYVYTDRNKTAFNSSMLAISDLRSAYDALVLKDSKISSVPKEMGTDEQWIYALEQLGSSANYAETIEEFYDVPSCARLQYCLPHWKHFNSNQKWFCFIAMKMFGVVGNSVLSKAVSSSGTIDDMIEHIYCDILEISRKSKVFEKAYVERKNLLEYLGNETKAGQFCNKVLDKGVEGLYYLTDLTEREREIIVTLCSEEGFNPEMLHTSYPDLYAYLKPYNFRDNLISEYFQQYKLCKVTNKISDELLEIVTEQGEKRDFITLLKPRSAGVEKFATKDCALYFVDAMGVEYLSFISEKCQKLGMTAHTTVCRCALPSLTRFNKEFIDAFTAVGACLVGEQNGIKDLDNLKHNVTLKYDYTRTKLPIHLCKELEIISDILLKVKQTLEDGRFKKAVVISDHGASRLAVIHEPENNYEMTEKGEHSGRCCPKSELDPNVASCITEANGYWIIANYDRFKGGRAASVEVHGGATLEEVTVPIIEITLGIGSVKVAIQKAKVEYSRKKPVRIQIAASQKLSDNSSVLVKGERYALNLKAGGTLLYETEDLVCIKRAGKYSAEVFDGDVRVGTVEFEAENKSFKENDMFRG